MRVRLIGGTHHYRDIEFGGGAAYIQMRPNTRRAIPTSPRSPNDSVPDIICYDERYEIFALKQGPHGYPLDWIGIHSDLLKVMATRLPPPPPVVAHTAITLRFKRGVLYVNPTWQFWKKGWWHFTSKK